MQFFCICFCLIRLELGSIITPITQTVAVADQGAGGGGGRRGDNVQEIMIDLTDGIDIESEENNVLQQLLPDLHGFQGGSTPISHCVSSPTSNSRKRGLNELTTTETLRRSSYNPSTSAAFPPLFPQSPRKRRRLSRDYNHNNQQSHLVSYIHIYIYIYIYIHT